VVELFGHIELLYVLLDLDSGVHVYKSAVSCAEKKCAGKKKEQESRVSTHRERNRMSRWNGLWVTDFADIVPVHRALYDLAERMLLCNNLRLGSRLNIGLELVMALCVCESSY